MRTIRICKRSAGLSPVADSAAITAITAITAADATLSQLLDICD
jgi:hypothetical protein